MRSIYEAHSEADVAFTTAKSVFGVKADSGHAIDLLALAFSLDSVTAAEAGVLIELCTASFATNAPGTNSTAVTIHNASGPRIAETFAAARNWTTEPTALVSLKGLEYDPYKFIYENPFPLGEGYDFALAEGFVLRCTAAATVNIRVHARWARV